MEPERKEEKGEGSGQGTAGPSQEAPQTKLRDLRPEKDPMGAGRPRLTGSTPEQDRSRNR